MSDTVVYYNPIVPVDFHQASIYLDACFILAYLDLNDERGEKVAHLLELWKEQGIRKIGISTHVFSEVVFTLFKEEVYTVLELAFKKSLARPRHLLTEEELVRLGDEKTAYQLLSYVGKEKIKRRFEGDDAYINIGELMKTAKASGREREHLSIYYRNALTRYNEFVHALSFDFGFATDTLQTNFDVLRLASSGLVQFQLEPTDALHLAITHYHQYDHFVTLDFDFVHDLYGTSLGTMKIVKLA